MEETLTIAKILGEENEKRLKATVTDLLIEQVKGDLDNMCHYLIDWEELFEEIRDEIKEEFRGKLREQYIKVAEEKLFEVFKDSQVHEGK